MDSSEILKHQGWVVKIASKYCWGQVEFLELVQAGNEGLMEALIRFDSSRGVKFLTYATPWVKKRIREAALIRQDEEFVDALSCCTNEGYDERFDLIMQAVEELSEKERMVVKERLQGKKLNEIGLDVTKQRVEQIEKAAHRKIRKKLKRIIDDLQV